MVQYLSLEIIRAHPKGATSDGDIQEMCSRARTDKRCDASHAFKSNYSHLRGFPILHLGLARKNGTFREVDEPHCISGFAETLSCGK
jgi:hypothetical protein